ncbi:MAG: hypothetical protein K0R17_2462 [Rariglobus sp.]|jgi:hypothetical protein|nr:hypothetical protein [Rariglobus sp.]
MTAFERYLERRVALVPARRTVLPTRYTNIVHAYQAVQPWSADQSRLLYAGFETRDACDIVVRDMATGMEQALAASTHFDLHTAASQRWVLDDSAVLFRESDGRGGVRRSLVRLEAPEVLEHVRELDGWDAREAIDRGRTISCSRRGEGGVLSEVSLFDLETRKHRILFNAEDVASSVIHGEKPNAGGLGFQHTVASGDGRRVFFKLDVPNPTGAPMPVERSFHAFDMVSGKFTDFGGAVLGHPAWIDERHIANIEKTRDGVDHRWLVSMDVETGEMLRLTTLAIEGPGHPCVSPDGARLVSDSFTTDGMRSRIYLLDFASGDLRELDCLDHLSKAQSGFYDPHVITRVHPHPTWSPDGRSIIGNCNFGGTRLGLVVWDGLDGG